MKQNISEGMLIALNAVSLRYQGFIQTGSVCHPCGGAGFKYSDYSEKCPCCDNGIVRAFQPNESKQNSLELAVAAFERAFHENRK